MCRTSWLNHEDEGCLRSRAQPSEWLDEGYLYPRTQPSNPANPALNPALKLGLTPGLKPNLKPNPIPHTSVHTHTRSQVIRTGMKHRHVGSHELNIESSRSHSIMTVYLTSTPADPAAADFGTPRMGKISFVDLAGSERLKASVIIFNEELSGFIRVAHRPRLMKWVNEGQRCKCCDELYNRRRECGGDVVRVWPRPHYRTR